MADASAAIGTAKTMLRIAAGTNDPVTIIGWWIWFDSVASTDKPIKVEILQETAVSAPTGTAVTPVDMTQSFGGTAQATVLAACTAEGTPTVTALESHMIPATSGIYVQYPLGREPIVPGAKAFRIRVTAVTNTVNVSYGIEWEE